MVATGLRRTRRCCEPNVSVSMIGLEITTGQRFGSSQLFARPNGEPVGQTKASANLNVGPIRSSQLSDWLLVGALLRLKRREGPVVGDFYVLVDSISPPTAFPNGLSSGCASLLAMAKA
jgi:hypothetical protein